jgi:hypothetical protein
MIGSLLYATNSRLDGMQVVGVVVRFQYSPKETHVQAVKKKFQIFEEYFGLQIMVSKR